MGIELSVDMKVMCKKNFIDTTLLPEFSIVYEVGKLYNYKQEVLSHVVYKSEKNCYSFAGRTFNEYFYTPEETRIEKLKNV